MSSEQGSRSPSRKRARDRSESRHKHSKRRRSDEPSGQDTLTSGGNSAAFAELFKQISGISEAVNSLGQRLTSLEAAATSNGSERGNNGHEIMAAECPVLSHNKVSVNDINSMDQLSVIVPPDQDLVDSIAPETLENDLGHGDSPETSELLNNDEVNTMAAKPPKQISEEKLGQGESSSKGQLFDPVDQDPSWVTSDSLKSFLDTNFRRSLSSSQIFSIVEEISLPDLDVFTTPKLDKATVDQVPFNLKSVEIRDKELLKIQRHVLNVAAPLTALHDLLENGQAVSVADTLGIVEKALCLLGNASNSLSVLRRHKVLYAINPKKVSLAEASYANAGKQLFGNDISKIASDSADISRNLQKNLSQSHPFSTYRFQFGKYQ